MKKFIIGKKLGMTTIYGETGQAQNVTLVECPANKISLLREVGKDGYSAVQVEVQKTAKRVLRKEFRTEASDLKVGDEVKVEIFEIGEKVNVSGTNKAKGFQGGVKRHGFKGSPKTHGHKHDLRAPGSIGATTPQHVIKGKRMAGRMGGVRVTGKNIKVAQVYSEKNMIALEGAVPGFAGSVVEIYVK